MAKRFLAGRRQDTPRPPSGRRRLAESSSPRLLGALDGSGEMSVRSAVTNPARDKVAQRQMNRNVKESRPDSFPIRPSGRRSEAASALAEGAPAFSKRRKRFRLVLWYLSTSPSRHFLPLLMTLLQFKGLQRELIARN